MNAAKGVCLVAHEGGGLGMGLAWRMAPMALVLALAACQAQPVWNTPAPGQPLVMAAGHLGGPSLHLKLALSPETSSYSLLAESTATNTALVHRWQSSDLMHYRVVLNERTAPNTFTPLPGLAGDSPINLYGAGAVSFTQLQAGRYYRVQVQAMGREGGNGGGGAIQQLNAAAQNDHADFDFTGNNDINPEVSATLQVHLDDRPFSGTGELYFASPLPGGYASPQSPLGIQALPTP